MISGVQLYEEDLSKSRNQCIYKKPKSLVKAGDYYHLALIVKNNKMHLTKLMYNKGYK